MTRPFIELPEETKSILYFGAQPDNSAKTDAAFEAFLTSEHQTLYVPPGTFMTAREIFVTHMPYKRIHGAGRDLTILRKEPGVETSNMVCNKPGLWLSDLTLQGPYHPGKFEGTGLSKAGLLFNPKASSARKAAAGMTLMPGDKVRSAGRYFYEYKNDLGHPVVLPGCEADDCETAGLTQVHPVISGLRVERVCFSHHTRSGLDLSNGAMDVTVNDCHFHLNKKMAIHAFKGVERLQVKGCDFTGNGSILQGDDATKSDVKSRSRPLKDITFHKITGRRNGGPGLGNGEAIIGVSGIDGFSLTESQIYESSTHIQSPECLHYTMLFNAGQDGFNPSKNIRIDRSVFDGTRLNHIRLVGVQGAKISNTTFRNAYNRAHVPAEGTASYIRLESVMNTSEKPHAAIVGCRDVSWSECIFEDNQSGGGVRSAVGNMDDLGRNIMAGNGNVFGQHVLPMEDVTQKPQVS